MAIVRILVTICARGGSKGVKNKNIRDLCGLPLIAYTILQAKRWGKAARIVCSTDSEDIASIARKYGADVPFMRPPELATDTVGKLNVIKHALIEMERITGEKYNIVVDLDATAPIREISDIDGALDLFRKMQPKTVFSVTPCRKNPYFNVVEEGNDRYVHVVKSIGTILSRQDAPKVYDMNASIYVYDREYLMDSATRSAISDRSLVWEMGEMSSVDVDTEMDFQFIEFLVSKGLVKL